MLQSEPASTCIMQLKIDILFCNTTANEFFVILLLLGSSLVLL